MQEGRAQLEANPREFIGDWIPGELAYPSASDAGQDGGRERLNIALYAYRNKLQEGLVEANAVDGPHTYLQGQTWRPKHVDAREQQAAEIQDVVMTEQDMHVDEGLAIVQDGVDCVEGVLLVGGQGVEGAEGLESSILVANVWHCQRRHSRIVSCHFWVFQAAVSGIVSLLADRGE